MGGGGGQILDPPFGGGGRGKFWANSGSLPFDGPDARRIPLRMSAACIVISSSSICRRSRRTFVVAPMRVWMCTQYSMRA